MLRNKIIGTIRDSAMLQGKDRVIAALSGGADSVALLYSLYLIKDELGFSLSACHVNHNLRGAESDGDEMFVRRLCRRLDIPLYVRNVKVLDLLQKHESVEERARKLRYDFFAEISKNAVIATAHTASDNCETVLINISRGTALSGACGIPAVRENIIRPLIGCTRQEIELFCKEHSLDFVTDSTNLCDDYTRNKIRHSIIPVLKDINPSFETAVSRFTESVSKDDRFLDKLANEAAKKAEKNGGYDTRMLSRLDDCLLRRIAASVLSENGIPSSSRAIMSLVQIIRTEKGKINPCQFKFIVIRKKILYVITDTSKFRKTI